MKHNFRKSVSFLLIGLVWMTAIIGSATTAQAAEAVDIGADSAILIDADSGKILYAKDADKALPPASMTKMMTEYLVWEAVESGDISWEDTTEISDYPYSISANPDFSGVGLKQNTEYTVKELYEAMAINSDNATTIALAELIAGSEADFVKMMNEKAEEMELPDYKFVNSTGLANSSLGDNYPEGTEPDDNNLMSSRSSALLAYHLINDYPEALDIAGIAETDFEDQEIRNWNWMLDHDASFLKEYYYEGVDGLKTGHTDLAGYTFTGTAEKDGTRLISVVMQSEDEGSRFKETAKLLDYGFSKFDTEEIFPEGYQLDDEKTMPVAKGKDKSVSISTADSYSAPVQKDDADNYHIEYTFDKDVLNDDGKLTAPVEKGDKVGVAKVTYDGDDDFGYITDTEDEQADQTIDIVADDDVEKNNWFMLILGAIGSFFSNLFHSIVDMVKGWF
ncbi:MAG TPA: serine hydrolase [Virgibacillus sp.]|nr:serine hydrolase [Virgibacillus sp.]